MDQVDQGAQGPSLMNTPEPVGPGGAEWRPIISAIVRTGPWVRFMAVLGFIGAGFMAVAGLIIMMAGGSSDLGMGMGLALGLFYLAMAAVYLVPLIALNRFANDASRLKEDPSASIAASAVEQSRSFWNRVGVLSIIGLAFIPLALIVSVFVALANR
jgi:hypothetical protein